MIFVVEDEAVLRRSLVEYLALGDRDVTGFESAEAALEAAKGSPPDVVISDLQLPGMGGLELLEELAELDASMVRIAVTAHSSTQTVLGAMRSGCYEYLEKPLDLEQLERLVDRALADRRAKRELSWLRNGHAPHGLGWRLLGESAAMSGLRGQLEMLGGIGVGAPPALIRGETGVGKGLIANLLHRLRFGDEAPFIEVNCAALPANLIEAELFGYERSAFTGATTAKPGLFEAAEGGTIFLDEIGELEIALQPKLLAVVESGKVRRVGGISPRTVSTTVIAATNVPLEDHIRHGRFRADLYHRLAAFTLEVPPLRERDGDAVLLARSFALEMAHKYKKALGGLSPEAEARVAHNPWPGNVRELRFAIERAVILTPAHATLLGPEHLPSGPGTPSHRAMTQASAAASARIVAGERGIEVRLPDEGIAFDDLERAILEAALESAGGNVAAAARRLQVTRETMRYRLKRLGIG